MGTGSWVQFYVGGPYREHSFEHRGMDIRLLAVRGQGRGPQAWEPEGRGGGNSVPGALGGQQGVSEPESGGVRGGEVTGSWGSHRLCLSPEEDGSPGRCEQRREVVAPALLKSLSWCSREKRPQGKSGVQRPSSE